jgi:serine/threonine protein kinase/tetratricopeptide (TPR) repeat protein
MTPERWERIKEILARVLDAPEVERENLIQSACGGEDLLEKEVRELVDRALGTRSLGPLATRSSAESIAPNSPFQSGKLMAGRFLLVRLLGRGGMGQVWEAIDQQLQVSVALKTLRPELLSDSKALMRFHREIVTARGVTHPNICRVYDLYTHEDGEQKIPFLTMELIVGESLAERLRRKALTPEEASAVLRQCAEALAAAHRSGVIHRDFKPGNVMLAARDDRQVDAIVMDFGLARLVRHGDSASITVGGTPGYMPPEQLDGKDVKATADVYSFAVVACELISGKRPFDGGLDALPKQWRNPIRRCLDVDPERRLQSPLTLLDQIHLTEKRRRSVLALAALCIVIAACVVAAFRIYRTTPQPSTVAILPFDTGERDADLQYLGDGIAEELINSLTRRPQLRVIARGSSFKFRQRNPDFHQISSALGVRFIIVGSVQRQNGHVRLRLELVDPQSGFQLWATSFDRPENEIFEIQEIAASQIAQQVSGKADNRQDVARALQNIDPDVHDLYLRGLFHLNKRTHDETFMALDLFKQAAVKTSDFAQLYTALADCYNLLGDYRFLPPREITQLADAAINKALSLDPNLAEAHASRGFWATIYGLDNRLAETNFHEAIRLNPNYVPAHQWYSQLLFKTRRFDEAEREAKLALQLDPISPAVNLNYGNFLFYSRDFIGLIRQANRQYEIDPALPFYRHHKSLGLAYLGKLSEAVAVMEPAKPLEGNDPLPLRIWAEILAVGGDKPRAREALAKLVSLYQEGRSPASFPAMIHALLGEPEKACDFLEKGIADLDTNLTLLDVAPPFDSLRQNPRFLAVRAQIFKETKPRN